MWPFRTDPREKSARIPLIRHCQVMLAHQQYAGEVYSKGAAAASDAPTDAPSAFQRQAAVFTSSQLVTKYLVPALERKVEIIRSMKEKHHEAVDLSVGSLEKAYNELTELIEVMLERALLQFTGFTEWATDQSLDLNVTRLDVPESTAIDRSVEALNRVIKKSGVTLGEWMEINGEAFNDVRADAGLPPLTQETFRDRYLGGLEGEGAWFFD